MAQPIHCDGPGDQHPADVLMSVLANGDTQAWCMVHYVDSCREVVAEVDAMVAAQEAAETDAAALARLDQVQAPEPTPDPEPEPMPDQAPAGDTFADPVRVVPRGQSASRKAHEARQRATEPETAPDTADEPAEAPGASTEPTEAPEPEPAQA